jgi:hypothetical protein
MTEHSLNAFRAPQYYDVKTEEQMELIHLGITLQDKIEWIRATKEQMNIMACKRSKNSSVEDIEGSSTGVYIPVCGSIDVKTFLEANREEMQLMWTAENIEGAEDAYTTLYMKHIPFDGDAEIAWTIELLRDLVSPYYLVRLGRMQGTLNSMRMTTEQMQAALILQPVFAEVANLLVCKHFPQLILSQFEQNK